MIKWLWRPQTGPPNVGMAGLSIIMSRPLLTALQNPTKRKKRTLKQTSAGQKHPTMTEAFFGRQTLSFYFGPHPICWLRGKGFSISTAARHQGMIKMFWHHYPAAKLSIIWTANIPPLLSSAGSPEGGACPTSDLSAEATDTLAHFWCISTHDGGLKPIWPIFWRLFTLFVYIVTDPICDTEEEYIGIGSLEL